MTILPKKKQTKEKNDSEGTSDPHSSGSTSDPSRGTGSRRTTSPQRWMAASNSLDPDRQHLVGPTPHESGSRRGYQEEYGSHDGGANHNKRRHRSSPHRSFRNKHRHDRGAGGSGSGGRASPPSSQPTHVTQVGTRNTGSPGPLVPQPPATQQVVVDQAMEEDGAEGGYNSEDEYGEVKHPENIELERWFEDSLRAKRGLVIKKMGEDGACLFRSVADQVFGDEEMHSVVRHMCVDYMAKNADFFKQYVTEEFGTYLKRKRVESCHGNHVEMQALSELYNRPIEVYQYGPEPINTFHGAYKTDNAPIRISYHRNVHYNSIIDPYKPTIGVGLGLPGYEPGSADKKLIGDAMQASEDSHLEKTMLEDKMRETDWELTQESMEEQVARESYLQWLKDNEKRNTRTPLARTASATCSSANDCMSSSRGEGTTSPEPRPSRTSPRGRSGNNSGPSSPLMRPEPTATATDSTASKTMELQVPGTPPPGPSFESPVATTTGAIGGAGVSNPETSSLMNDLYRMSAWDEQDILAQVIAQSEQEYYDSLKRSASQAPSSAGRAPHDHNTPCCSNTLPLFDSPFTMNTCPRPSSTARSKPCCTATASSSAKAASASVGRSPYPTAASSSSTSDDYSLTNSHPAPFANS